MLAGLPSNPEVVANKQWEVLAKNSPNFASLRTTIPMNMVRQWNLKPRSKLDWSWEVVNGEMVIVVRRKEQKDWI
jgi:hypothetical protein